MALPEPPPPPRPAPLHIFEADDLPYVAPTTTLVSRGGFLGHPRKLEQAARVGLVLAIVVALAGVVGAVSKSGDDGSTRLASRGDEAKVVEDPLADDDADADDEPADEVDPYLVPDGFQVVQGDGVYLALPDTWESLSPRTAGRMLDDETLEEIFPDVDPDLRDAMHAAVSSGALLMSIDPDPLSGGANITIATLPYEMTFDEIRDDAEQELEAEAMGMELHGTREVETPLGKALRIAYSGEIGDYSFDGVQYWLPVDGETYILTGTAAADITDAAIQTLHLGEAPTPA